MRVSTGIRLRPGMSFSLSPWNPVYFLASLLDHLSSYSSITSKSCWCARRGSSSAHEAGRCARVFLRCCFSSGGSSSSEPFVLFVWGLQTTARKREYSSECVAASAAFSVGSAPPATATPTNLAGLPRSTRSHASPGAAAKASAEKHATAKPLAFAQRMTGAACPAPATRVSQVPSAEPGVGSITRSLEMFFWKSGVTRAIGGSAPGGPGCRENWATRSPHDAASGRSTSSRCTVGFTTGRDFCCSSCGGASLAAAPPPPPPHIPARHLNMPAAVGKGAALPD
mmetsp:Transcript_41104/g.106308  ORF Transcript_41104/g.106308 Transcript_41104/m.106308 type:complete len:283 (-) Transcript_41104:6-854(-)